jgi:hypothetical protein
MCVLCETGHKEGIDCATVSLLSRVRETVAHGIVFAAPRLWGSEKTICGILRRAKCLNTGNEAGFSPKRIKSALCTYQN